MSLHPDTWTPLLTARALGRAVNHYEHTLTSTNLILKDMARQGAPHGCTCLCECQTAGRGRMDRSWSSPEGQGVWLSVLLRPQMQPETAPLITFCCAIAMARAVRSVTALEQRLQEIARLGFKRCVVPASVRGGARIPEGLQVLRVKNVREAINAVVI